METAHQLRSQSVETSSIQTTRLPHRDFSPADRAQWRDAISRIYREMRAKSSNGPYEVSCGALTLTVLPNVYAPKFFTDSLWFAQQVPKLVGTKSLLEIGTGTGIISIAWARNGASVIATDVNPDAVTNARLNVANHQLDIRIREETCLSQ